MKNQTDIRKTAFSAILTALSVTLIFLGGLFDILDLTVSAACSLITAAAIVEVGIKYSALIYFAASALSFVIFPMTTAGIYYAAFFGYYPIARRYIKKLPKTISAVLRFALFNAVMIIIMLVFKEIFALQNEPASMYVLLAAAGNVFFFCYDLVLDKFDIIYKHKLKKIFRFKI